MDKNEKETHVILARSHVMDEFAKNNHYVYVSDYKMFQIIQKVGDNRTRGILISFWCSFRPSLMSILSVAFHHLNPFSMISDQRLVQNQKKYF